MKTFRQSLGTKALLLNCLVLGALFGSVSRNVAYGAPLVTAAVPTACRALSELAYRDELPRTEIKNQCALGSCSYFSYLSRVERNFKLAGKSVALSEEDFSIQHLKFRIRHALADNRQDFLTLPWPGFEEWGPVIAADYGSLPQEAWQGVVFSKWPFAKIQAAVEEEVDRARTRMITEDQRFRVLFDQGQITETEIMTKLNSMAEALTENILRRSVYKFVGGRPAESFIYEGQRISRKQFVQLNAQAFALGGLTPVVIMRPALQVGELIPTPPKQTQVTGRPVTPLRVPRTYRRYYVSTEDQAENEIAQQLAMKHPVSLNFIFDPNYVNLTSGEMRYDGGSNLSPNRYGHFAQVVASARDADGHLVLKLQFSWGPRLGDHGYFYMHQSYFRKFVREVNIE